MRCVYYFVCKLGAMCRCFAVTKHVQSCFMSLPAFVLFPNIGRYNKSESAGCASAKKPPKYAMEKHSGVYMCVYVQMNFRDWGIGVSTALFCVKSAESCFACTL